MDTPTARDAVPSRCSRCGATFHCGIDDPGGCWCAQLPALPLGALESGRGCLCPSCLSAVTATTATGHA